MSNVKFEYIIINSKNDKNNYIFGILFDYTSNMFNQLFFMIDDYENNVFNLMLKVAVLCDYPEGIFKNRF